MGDIIKLVTKITMLWEPRIGKSGTGKPRMGMIVERGFAANLALECVVSADLIAKFRL
jgi:hypothetical protein